MAVVVVFSTFPNPDKAAEVAKILVEERLAACVNIVPQVRSIYRWKGETCDDSEVLCVVKTTQERFDALARRLVGLHPYELPEVIALLAGDGHAPYLAWVSTETT
jgi:periplasmic divalent cation tolerance protein